METRGAGGCSGLAVQAIQLQGVCLLKKVSHPDEVAPFSPLASSEPCACTNAQQAPPKDSSQVLVEAALACSAQCVG
eukprot:CAMPEP_0168455030 /NCGR_PEP_ID=MMETSP0228-20121227/50533_1 /TAXON_ID=133427 /ORGANISM="Protoceratium reticulatum, Strain CCCM 535 (=CCMP 1889)" /LENGTH=76 /DNA_ID=CAMNT_0008469849 /DNA_START=25 /DNA_END=251 /DNA_ORIENTATION=+